MARTAPTTRHADLWTFALPVRWGDMDMLGHVNNCEFFRYAESARLAFFEEVFGRDKPLFTSGSGPILADIGCTYHEQLRYPAELDVGVQITHIGSRSLHIATPVFRRGEDRAVADVRSILVWFDYEAQQATSVPQALHDRLQPLND